MPFCESRADSKAFTSLEIISYSPKTLKPDNWIQTWGMQQEGHLRTEQSWQPSSTKPEVIRGRVRAEVNSMLRGGAKCYKQWWLSMRAQAELRQALFTGRDGVSTGRLGKLELDEFIKGSAVSPSCHLSPRSQTSINGRNTSKTTFSTRPRKQGCI